MLQCRPPLDGFLNETLQGMERSLTSSVTVCCTRQGVERSLTSLGTVVPDKGQNVHSLHGVLWYGVGRSFTSRGYCGTRQGVERSLTSWGTVVPDKGRNVHSLHGVLWYQTRSGNISIHVVLGACVMY